MPRYFIDSSDGARDVEDDSGLELASDRAARSAALDALADMVRDVLPDGDHRIFSVNVRNATGGELYQAKITLEGKWLEPGSEERDSER
ncbi:DUF6894 family protein [Bosea sp. BH3]|uniref:DUF6894 family protein n=1 Tax=Bosea sp. BH3 TaxID=2871701 RepID=UPI0021CB1E77|nr:hypothetical protein [Bosea sp. BH3]MCU4181078.1 hypothetical protein [Bosea sp. BH3]